MTDYQERIQRFCALNPQAPQTEILLSRTLFRAASLLQQRINEALAPCNMTMAQYLAMAMLMVDDGAPTNPSEVSILLDMTRTQVTRLMDSLEAEGWITRRMDNEDRRRMMLALTEEGKAQLKRAAPLVHEMYREAWSPFPGDDKSSISSHLAHFYDGLRPGKHAD